jgi:hypothetical protein
MRKAEQALWDTMRRNKPAGCWLQRIENMAGSGEPDVLVIRMNFCGWAELKAPMRPKRETTALLGKKEGLRPSQINWHLKAATYGVPTYILIRDNHGALLLVPGSLAKEVNNLARNELKKRSVAESWKTIFEVLS